MTSLPPFLHSPSCIINSLASLLRLFSFFLSLSDSVCVFNWDLTRQATQVTGLIFLLLFHRAHFYGLIYKYYIYILSRTMYHLTFRACMKTKQKKTTNFHFPKLHFCTVFNFLSCVDRKGSLCSFFYFFFWISFCLSNHLIFVHSYVSSLFLQHYNTVKEVVSLC